ncbi:MAG TPA: GNAT family protein [Gaiellaceae bacterium]|nr:GNAT family protein [Gaiellaceae bacterium]
MAGSGGAPPRRLATPRLVLRRYEPGDAPLVKDAVDSSLEHLRAFMDWAWVAPEPIGVVRARLRDFRSAFDHADDYIYGMFTPDGSELVGGAGLHARVGPGALEIGYWVRASRVRRGLATEAAAALTRVAFERCGVIRVEIHVDPENVASIAVAAGLGYVREATLRKRLPPVRPGGARRDEVVFSLLDEEYASSPAAEVPIEYY